MNPFKWLTSTLSTAFTGAAAGPPKKLTLEEVKENFFDAIEKEDITVIQETAARHPDFNDWRSAKGWSPNRHAQEWNSFQSFVQLTALGTDRNEDYGNGWTPLLTALNRDDSSMINYLIDGKSQNLSGIARDGDRSFTALHLAVLNRDADRVLEMIENGADVNVKASPRKDAIDVTPQQLAEMMKMPRVAEMLGLADEIRAVKKQEFAAMEAAGKANAYVPKPEDPPTSPFRGTKPATPVPVAAAAPKA